MTILFQIHIVKNPDENEKTAIVDKLCVSIPNPQKTINKIANVDKNDEIYDENERIGKVHKLHKFCDINYNNAKVYKINENNRIDNDAKTHEENYCTVKVNTVNDENASGANIDKIRDVNDRATYIDKSPHIC